MKERCLCDMFKGNAEDTEATRARCAMRGCSKCQPYNIGLIATLVTTPRFIGYEYEIHENSQGIFKLLMKFNGKWRYLQDSDTMGAIIGSHISTDYLFFGRNDVDDFIEKEFKEVHMGPNLSIKDDFKKVI